MSDSTEIHRIYTEAMNASLENAIRWLEDAKLLAEHGSEPHCRALQNFAGEELAKATGCWLVVNKYLKSSHTLVKYDSGVFRDHDVKNLVITVLGAFVHAIIQLEKQNRQINRLNLEEYVQIPLLDSIYVEVASRGEGKRIDWIYVDIYRKNNAFEVSNPLKIETDDFFEITFPFQKKLLGLVTEKIKGAYDMGVYLIKFMKQLIQNPRSDIADLFHEEIMAKYELYEINRRRIKNRRSKRKKK